MTYLKRTGILFPLAAQILTVNTDLLLALTWQQEALDVGKLVGQRLKLLQSNDQQAGK